MLQQHLLCALRVERSAHSCSATSEVAACVMRGFLVASVTHLRWVHCGSIMLGCTEDNMAMLCACSVQALSRSTPRS